ncbi:hypothetical protein [Spirulina sp. 06S082]|uniref:hypothetical protein n=1 Tax=Spirulina sp. 06S082 TaxID=3110248 RepID=UPI002B1EBA96|nr:hypothetical protein [Spirulina sp. 06S082]MEA5467879.1 hypothetical protein [Spirulina sp. 06S082]
MALFLEEENLSYAWGRAFLHIMENPGTEISPLLISLTGFIDGLPQEDKQVRECLDRCLLDKEKQKIDTVANTIFPASYLSKQRYINDRKKIFETYLKCFQKIQKSAPSKNKRGTYFERLIHFSDDVEEYGNQLEYIISQYRSRPGVRRTMFQASIFDPRRDHVGSAQLPFPCLQHISLIPQKDRLTLNGFYATQQIFEKAYGNYIGLCRLGKFMAREMGLTFERLNCFIGVAKIDTINKSDPTIESLKKILHKNSENT